MDFMSEQILHNVQEYIDGVLRDIYGIMDAKLTDIGLTFFTHICSRCAFLLKFFINCNTKMAK